MDAIISSYKKFCAASWNVWYYVTVKIGWQCIIVKAEAERSNQHIIYLLFVQNKYFPKVEELVNYRNR